MEQKQEQELINNNEPVLVKPQTPEITAESTKNPKIKKPVLLLIFILLIAVLFVAFKLIYNNQLSSPVTENKPQSQATFAGPKLAYIAENKLWISGTNGQDKKSFDIGEGTIRQLYNWSPDNKYVLAKFEKFSATDKNIPGDILYLAIEAQNGKVTELKFPKAETENAVYKTVNSNFIWVSNSELRYVAGNNVHQVDLTGSNKVVATFPVYDVMADFLEQIFISNDGQKVVYTGSYPRFQAPRPSGKLFVYDLKTGKGAIVTENVDKIKGWVGARVAYNKGKSIKLHDLDTKTEETLADYETDNPDVIAMTVSNDQSLISYAVHQSKWQIYTLTTDTKTSNLLKDIKPDAIPTWGGFSDDNKYLAFAVSSHPGGNLSQSAVTVNLATGETYELCKGGYGKDGNFIGYCDFPVWQN